MCAQFVSVSQLVFLSFPFSLSLSLCDSHFKLNLPFWWSWESHRPGSKWLPVATGARQYSWEVVSSSSSSPVSQSTQQALHLQPGTFIQKSVTQSVSRHSNEVIHLVSLNSLVLMCLSTGWPAPLRPFFLLLSFAFLISCCEVSTCINYQLALVLCTSILLLPTAIYILMSDHHTANWLQWLSAAAATVLMRRFFSVIMKSSWVGVQCWNASASASQKAVQLND